MSEQTQQQIGKILTGSEQRDAIHFAVAPMEAIERLAPGQHVWKDNFGHIRQRLFFVADADDAGRKPVPRHDARTPPAGDQPEGRARSLGEHRDAGSMAYAAGTRPHGIGGSGKSSRRVQQQPVEYGAVGVALGDANKQGSQGRSERAGSSAGQLPTRPPGPVNGHWHDAEWLPCRDGKARPVEPGTFPLASGIAERVGLLRGYGNAIVAPVAEEFIRAYLEWQP